MDAYEAEEELKQRQGAALYPLGRALRATYDADNHDTLGSDVTGLMLELTRLPYEPGRACARAEPHERKAPDRAPPDPSRGGWLDRLRTIWRG